jgi:hypothetical protein
MFERSQAAEASVLAVLPAFVRRSDSAAVRDAIVAALAVILLRYEELSGYAADQCDIATATGIYLDGVCDDRGVYRQLRESDHDLRARALTTPDLVTPAAILAAANSILARYTSIQAHYAESVLDRWFVGDGTETWRSFVGASPTYFARLYPADAAANDGFVRPNSTIGGAWSFEDQLGRHFIRRVPALDGLSSGHTLLTDGADGAFVMEGASPANAGLFVPADDASALSVLQSIVSAVNRIKGHSVRWTLVSDPDLVN